MSDVATALAGARFDGLVSIREIGPQGMITLRGDLADATTAKAATTAAGLGMPDQRGAQSDGEYGLLWMSPDELMVLCPYGDVATKLSEMTATLKDAHALAVDVSDARAVFRLEGAKAREVLAKLTPADIRAGSLPVGELRRTRIAQVPCAFWFRDDSTVDLICFRSVAKYVFDLLTTAAKPGTAVFDA